MREIYTPIEPPNDDYYEQNERVAIVIHCGGLSERDAEQQTHLIMCRKRTAEAVLARRVNEQKIMGQK